MLARRLATCGLTRSLLGAGHDDDAAVAGGEMQESSELVVISASTIQSFLNDVTGRAFQDKLDRSAHVMPYKRVAVK